MSFVTRPALVKNFDLRPHKLDVMCLIVRKGIFVILNRCFRNHSLRKEKLLDLAQRVQVPDLLWRIKLRERVFTESRTFRRFHEVLPTFGFGQNDIYCECMSVFNRNM